MVSVVFCFVFVYFLILFSCNGFEWSQRPCETRRERDDRVSGKVRCVVDRWPAYCVVGSIGGWGCEKDPMEMEVRQDWAGKWLCP